MKSKLTTKGFEEYLEKLAMAGEDIDGISDEALVAGGKVLVAGMKRRVRVREGNLKKNITMLGPTRDGNFHFVEVGLLKTDKKTAIYGKVQEFGSSSVKAQPYIRPTFSSDMARARAEMREVFKARGAL